MASGGPDPIASFTLQRPARRQLDNSLGGKISSSCLLYQCPPQPANAESDADRARGGPLGELPFRKGVAILTNRIAKHLRDGHDLIRDRAVGALIGLAVGDAVGTTLEFHPRDSYEPLTEMIGGGPFCLAPGEGTDDTSMALALADSLLADPNLDPDDLMTRFVAWRDNGKYSCVSECFDIGRTTSDALDWWEQTGDPLAGSTSPKSAGNGSLMRLAPVALVHWQNRPRLADVAARQSRTTHAAPEAVSACIAFANVLADAIAGMPKDEVLRARRDDYAGEIAAIMVGQWRGQPRSAIKSTGYVADSLEASLWSVDQTDDFRSAVLLAANLGGDADTTAAITGQLAGALYGVSGIPSDWLSKLAWREQIIAFAEGLADLGLKLSRPPEIINND